MFCVTQKVGSKFKKSRRLKYSPSGLPNKLFCSWLQSFWNNFHHNGTVVVAGVFARARQLILLLSFDESKTLRHTRNWRRRTGYICSSFLYKVRLNRLEKEHLKNCSSLSDQSSKALKPTLYPLGFQFYLKN